MYRGNSSRLLPIVLVLIVVAIVIAGLVAAGRAIFSGDQGTSPNEANIGRDALLNTAADRSVRMTVRGPLVAEENFRSYQIAVDSSSRSLITYSGYIERPLEEKRLDNNAKAYEELIYALDKANLMKGEELTGEKDDTRGICATGKVYEFEVLKNNSTVKRLWTSTCKGSSGSLKASVQQVEGLFLKQIPDNKELLKKVDLSSGLSVF